MSEGTPWQYFRRDAGIEAGATKDEKSSDRASPNVSGKVVTGATRAFRDQRAVCMGSNNPGGVISIVGREAKRESLSEIGVPGNSYRPSCKIRSMM